MAKTEGMTIGGVPVKDAKRPYDLDVTQPDIDHGNPKDPRGCAGAVAVKRQMGRSCEWAEVHSERTYVKPKGSDHVLRYRTPDRLKQELIAFDRGGREAMRPFSCTLGPLTTSRQTGKRQGGSTDKPPRRRIAQLVSKRRGFITGIRDRGANR